MSDGLQRLVTRVIFLDMDGVLNSNMFFQSHPKNNPGTQRVVVDDQDIRWWTRMVDPITVERLNKIIEATGAKVVISSSWRYHNTPERMQEILDHHGFVGEVIGRTPQGNHLPRGIQNLGGIRGHEIHWWLVKNTHLQVADNFVILDDMSPSAFAHMAEYLIETSWAQGLLDHHVEEAIKRLRD